MSKPKRLHEVAQPIFVAEVYIVTEDEVLMFKRSETKKKFPGFWSIPGGHIDEGEDPLTAAMREVEEETGVIITSDNVKLKVVAMHHHLDRKEIYIAFAFLAKISSKTKPKQSEEEGQAHWVKKAEILALDNIFPPVKYYFNHVLEERPGIIYNNSQWEKNKLVKVLSEVVDRNY